MSRSASSWEALISWMTLMIFLAMKRMVPSPKSTSIPQMPQAGRNNLSWWASRQVLSRNISFPSTSVNSTALLWQQIFRRVYLDSDSLWWAPFSRLTYIWYQCETRSRAMSDRKIQLYLGSRAARMARNTPLEARSQTMSRTAPNRVDWLNFRAAHPSKASRVWLTAQRRTVSPGRSRQVKKVAKRATKRRQPMRLGMKRNTMGRVDLKYRINAIFWAMPLPLKLQVLSVRSF